jgi:hypothetical protein
MRCRVLVLAALCGCIEVPGPAPVVCAPGADRDGDGWACDARLPDCDDDDDAIHPGADEIAGDGVDQDCLRGDPSPDEMLAGVVVDLTGDNPEVQMPGGWVRFPSTGARFPDELVVGLLAWDVLYDGPGAATGMGMALDPLFRTPDVVDAPELQVVATGPAIGIASLTWADDAGGTPIEGTSYLWFFPDGRIVRHDRVDVQEAITGTDLDLSAYVTLAAGPFTHLRWNGLAGGVPVDADTESELWSAGPEQDGFLCLYDEVSGGMTGFGWYTEGAGAGPRATAGSGGVTFRWDWVRGGTEIDPISYYLASVTFYEASGVRTRCDVSLRDLGLFDGDVLDPRGAAVLGELDGASVGRFLFSMQSTEPYAEAVALDPDVSLPVHAVIPGDEVDGVTVWLDGVQLAAGVDYLRQYGDAGTGVIEVFLYLPAIDADQVLRVAARGGEP